MRDCFMTRSLAHESQFSVYLFDMIVIFCKHIPGTMASPATKLKLKGRIFMKNINKIANGKKSGTFTGMN